MKTTNSLVMMATRLVLSFALLAALGIGLLLPTSAPHSRNRTALHAAQPVQVADGTESNGGKGDKPKKRQMPHLA